MEISVAIDGTKKRDLIFYQGDDLSIVLKVYAHDGDDTPIVVENVRFDAPAGTVPMGVPFTVPYNYIGRSPYRIVGDVAGITTTLAIGIIQTPGGWPSVCCWGYGNFPFPWGVVGKADNITVLDEAQNFSSPISVEGALAELGEFKKEAGDLTSAVAEAQQAATDAEAAAQAAVDTLAGTVKKVELAAPTGAGEVGFRQVGGGAVATDLEKRVRQLPKTIIDFGGYADGSTDIKAPLEDALAAGLGVYFPDGDYFLSSPILPQEGMWLRGAAELPVNKTRSPRIYAPNGFLYNGGASRIRAEIYGLFVKGAAASGVHGMYGKMGGLFEGLYFEDWDACVINQQSYLSDYTRCKFGKANKGLWLNETNLVRVQGCSFNGDVLVQVDNQALTPGGSLIGGSGLVLHGNNHNIVAATQALARLTHAVSFCYNYAEAYESMPTGVALIDYMADRFAYASLDLHQNHMVGQNNCDRALQIYSNSSSGTVMHGTVGPNWMRGFRERSILVGNKSGGFNQVTGINFEGNEANQAQAVEFTSYVTPDTQPVQASYSAATLNISGIAFIPVPLTDDIPRLGADLTAAGGTAWRVGRAGLYQVDASVLCKSQTADLPALEAAVQVNGATIPASQRFFSIMRNATAGNRYVPIPISPGVLALAAGDLVQIVCRNGDLLHRATLSAHRIGDDCFFKV